MRELALAELFGLGPGDPLGLVDQKAHDPRLVDVALPELEGELVVPPHLLGQLAQLGEPDAEAAQSAVGVTLLRVRDAAGIGLLPSCMMSAMTSSTVMESPRCGQETASPARAVRVAPPRSAGKRPLRARHRDARRGTAEDRRTGAAISLTTT